MGFGGATGYGDGDPEDEHNDGPDDEPRDRPRSSLPDPMDRVWLHPSELSPLAAATVTRTKPMWPTTLLAGAAGAILTLSVLGAVGAIGGSNNEPARAATTSVPIMTTQALAIAVANSVVAVSAHDGDGTKRRGSGVCVRKSGEILTSYRLVGKADKVSVTTADGVVHEARVVGRDATTDLVLLSLASTRPGGSSTNGSKMATNALGVPAQAATQRPKAGDTVWVVGAPTPGDTSPWVSSGLVASTDGLVADKDGPITSGLLETAAASNKASSGGALVDRAGNVTGIILSAVGDNRITYAVPISTALSVAHDFRARGFTAHGALGVNGVNAPAGPTITDAIAGGPAALAGIRAGDIVETIGKHAVDSMSDLVALVRHYRPGDVVKVEVLRGSKSLWVSARLTSMTS